MHFIVLIIDIMENDSGAANSVSSAILDQNEGKYVCFTPHFLYIAIFQMIKIFVNLVWMKYNYFKFIHYFNHFFIFVSSF